MMPLTPFAGDLVRAAAVHLWQATLFGLLVAPAASFLPMPARLRHLTASLALLRFAIPAALFAPLVAWLPWSAVPAFVRPSGAGGVWMPAFVVGADPLTAGPGVFRLPGPALLLAIWAAGTAACAAGGGIRLFRSLRAVAAEGAPFPPEDCARLAALAGRVGIGAGRVVGIVVPSAGWLGVTGIFRSRIVVPEGLFRALDGPEMESVLLHELVHVKRHDNLRRLLQAGLVSIFWFHPLVWWLDRRLREESERACDEEVLRLTDAGQVYARSLFKAMRYALGLDLPGVSGMSRTGLSSRLRDVLNHKDRKDSPVKRTLITSAVVGLLGVTTLFASAPAASTDAGAAAGKLGKAESTPSTAASAAGDKVMDIKDVDQAPVVLHQVQPRYPAELKKQGVRGEVKLSFVVDENGDVGSIRILKATNDGFGQAAAEAVATWKFKPGLKADRPVKVALNVPIIFALSN